jgi:hypothetical protein
MEKIKSEIEPKKKRSSIPIVIIIILGLALFLLLRFDRTGLSDSTFTWTERVIYFFVATIVVFLFIGFSKLPKKFRMTSAAWIRVIFINLIWPLLFFILILLGAITEKYPVQSYPNGTFSDNLNKSFSISSHAMFGAFQRVAIFFYDLGQARPDFWIFAMVMFVVLSIFIISVNIKEDILSQMDAQELIDDIKEKDYKDLEEWEHYQEFKKKNGFLKGFILQLKNEKYSFDFWKTIIFSIIAVATLVGGIYLWFK